MDDQFEKDNFTDGRFDDKKFIERGNWETCSLKQRPKEGEPASATGYKAFGVITDRRHPLIVYLRSFSGSDFQETMKYTDVTALLADGWIVD